MSIFGKAKISTALDKRRPHNFNSRHITTADFFQLVPIYHREMVPQSSINIDVRSFARLKDMPVPTFGEAKLNLRAFFVPMRTIYRGWDDFITDALHVNSGSQYANHDEYVPYILNSQFLDLFKKSDVSTTVTSSVFDFGIISNDTTTVKKNFTPFGKQIYKILQCLGYVVAQDERDTTRFSALPLLSFVRAYLDWYYPSQYYGDTTSALLMSLCLRDSSQDPSFNADRLLAMFKVVAFVAYGDDYFTSAFDSPNGPTDYANVGASVINILDINEMSLGNTGVFQVNNSKDNVYYPNTPIATSFGTAGDQATDGVEQTFSQFVIDALKSLTDFMKRHQLVGARAFERYAARFGVELPASKLNRSVYLGSHQVDLMVQDVMSTAETTDANLGSYAGKGIIAGEDGHFNYETDEFGYFIICASLVPDIAYCQGIDRKVRHLSKLDFFSPEFDCLGTQAVARDELFVPQTMAPDSHTGFRNLDEGVFGFMPKYAEYKIPRNQLTGDFAAGSTRIGDTAPCWHLFRLFGNDSFGPTQATMVHSKSFVIPFANTVDTQQFGYGDATQYDRIFYNTDQTEDHFICLFYFKEEHLLPMKPLWDTYEFKDEQEHDSRVVDVNGIKMN